MKNQNATIELMGIGPLSIDTDLQEIVLLKDFSGGLYSTSETMKVSRDKRAAKKAANNRRFFVKKLDDGRFELVERDLLRVFQGAVENAEYNNVEINAQYFDEYALDACGIAISDEEALLMEQCFFEWRAYEGTDVENNYDHTVKIPLRAATRNASKQ